MNLANHVRSRTSSASAIPSDTCKGVARTYTLESLVIKGFLRGLSTRDVEAASENPAYVVKCRRAVDAAGGVAPNGLALMQFALYRRTPGPLLSGRGAAAGTMDAEVRLVALEAAPTRGVSSGRRFLCLMAHETGMPVDVTDPDGESQRRTRRERLLWFVVPGLIMVGVGVLVLRFVSAHKVAPPSSRYGPPLAIEGEPVKIPAGAAHRDTAIGWVLVAIGVAMVLVLRV